MKQKLRFPNNIWNYVSKRVMWLTIDFNFTHLPKLAPFIRHKQHGTFDQSCAMFSFIHSLVSAAIILWLYVVKITIASVCVWICCCSVYSRIRSCTFVHNLNSKSENNVCLGLNIQIGVVSTKKQYIYNYTVECFCNRVYYECGGREFQFEFVTWRCFSLLCDIQWAGDV